MKRNAPLLRKTPLQSTGGLKRKSGGLHPRRQRARTIKLKAPRNFPHMGRVKALGCIVCRHQNRGWVAADAHHIRDGYGASQRALDEETFPLCRDHHTDGGFGVAFHSGEREWQKNHGTERELLAETLQDLQNAELMASLPSAG